MSGPEYEDFASLWVDEPDDIERALFERIARKAERRARLMQYLEIGVAAVLVAAMTGLLLWHRQPTTSLLALAVAGAVGWSSWKRYRFHQHALFLDGTGRETMLASAVERTRARLRASALGLVLLVPSWLLALALKGTMEMGGDFDRFLVQFLPSLSRTPGLAAIVGMLLLLGYFGRAHIRLRRELGRLESLLEQYRSESALDRKS